MTRKTALRRMLAGKKVYHPRHSAIYFYYDDQICHPIRMICRSKSGIRKLTCSGYIEFFQYRTGWKEYRPEEKCQNQE